MYQVRSTGVLIAGYIVGGGSAPATLTCMNNSFYNRGNTCSAYAYYHGINSILAHYGMSIVAL